MRNCSGRLAGLACALLALTLMSPVRSMAAAPASSLGPEVAVSKPRDGYVGRMDALPDHGPAGTPVTVTAEGLPAGQEFQVRVLGSGEETEMADADSVKGGLRDAFGEGTYDVLRVERVGPKVGKDLWRQATQAVLFATLIMGTYIAFRFDLRFGVGAAVALIHDVLFTVAALSIAHMEFDLTTVAGLLTVVGFSVHDTVIISDRIRENMRKLRKESLASLINLSVNETLSRTIITNGTAITVTGALFLLGGSTIHSFAFTLLIGSSRTRGRYISYTL